MLSFIPCLKRIHHGLIKWHNGLAPSLSTHSLMGASFTPTMGKNGIGLLAFNLTKTRLYLPNHEGKDDDDHIRYMKSLGISDQSIEVRPTG